MAAPAQAMTDMLSRFGVNYPDAPPPTPALLAFMRATGLSLDTAEDTHRRTIGRIGNRKTTAYGDIKRASGRKRTNIVGDLARRGVTRSGEATTRFSRHDEDVAQRRAEVARRAAESIDHAGSLFRNTTDLLRTSAMDRVMGSEEAQATRKGQSDAQTAALKAQEAAADKAFGQQTAAQERWIKEQERLIRLGQAQ